MEALVLPLAIGPWQIALIVVVVLLLFGGKKIPELMRGLGSGIKEFKDASKDEKNDQIEEKKYIFCESSPSIRHKSFVHFQLETLPKSKSGSNLAPRRATTF